MGELLYIDDVFAAFLPDREHESSRRAVDAFLKLNENKGGKHGYSAQLRSVITNHGTMCGSLYAEAGLKLDDEEAARVDERALQSIGIELVTEGQKSPEVRMPCSPTNDYSGIHLVRISAVHEAAESLQYLARLYLTSLGQDCDRAVIQDTALFSPSVFDECRIWIASCIPERFETNSETGRPGVVRRSPGERIYSLFWNGLRPPETKADTMKAAASLLFADIVNAPQVKRFRVNPSTFEPEVFNGVSETDELILELASLAAEGRIMPCPNPSCRRPIARITDGKKPFCDRTCQQRYKEQAQKAYKEGLTPGQTAEKFPYIKGGVKTIENWDR